MREAAAPEPCPSLERGPVSKEASEVAGSQVEGKLKAVDSAVCWGGDLEIGEVERPGRDSLSCLQWPFLECERTLQRGADLAFQMTSSSP